TTGVQIAGLATAATMALSAVVQAVFMAAAGVNVRQKKPNHRLYPWVIAVLILIPGCVPMLKAGLTLYVLFVKLTAGLKKR
ncbi:hypothetical protein KJ965_00450, partial [Patescibacteria group bacterium]|nr:hypothetical protein [Patescibacteria group bacterium]